MCFTRFSAIFILFSPFPQGQNNGKVVPREPQTGEDVSWTGDGFVEIKDKATLEYAVTNVPYTGEYNILVRYEPKVWFLIGLDFCVRKRDVQQTFRDVRSTYVPWKELLSSLVQNYRAPLE